MTIRILYARKGLSFLPALASLICMNLQPALANCQGLADSARGRLADIDPPFDPINAKLPSTIYLGMTSFFEKEGVKGSQYLSRHWLAGLVQFSDNRRLLSQKSFGFNYDKENDRVVATRDGQNIIELPKDSITSFILVDSNHIYHFEKVLLISSGNFLQSIIKETHKYSLYRELFTKFRGADNAAVGSASPGRKYDEFVDAYKYYIVYPGGQEFKQLNLSKSSVRKALKGQSGDVDIFLSHFDGPMTEEVLSLLLESLNDKITH